MYTGFDFDDTKTVPELKDDKMPSTESFFSQFVAIRKPVALRGFCGLAKNEGWDLEAWNLSAMKTLAGESLVQVERRSSSDQSFGQSGIESMKFSKFIQSLQNNEEHLYLTAQTSASSERLLHTPLDRLQSICGGHPEILSNLHLHSVNLWMGRSIKGASSKLHHDYHDNLYIVIKGTKTFHLFAPSNATKLSTHGKPIRIHPNGLINYENYKTRADGALHEEADLEDRKENAELCVRMAEEAVERGDPGAEAMLEKAEEELDSVLDAYLETVEESVDCTAEPLSFCKVSHSQAHLSCNGGTVSLEAGDALYLPSGWFHEVISEIGSSEVHLAVNFWFHPPDILDSSHWKHPYQSHFWNRRKRRLSDERQS